MWNHRYYTRNMDWKRIIILRYDVSPTIVAQYAPLSLTNLTLQLLQCSSQRVGFLQCSRQTQGFLSFYFIN